MKLNVAILFALVVGAKAASTRRLSADQNEKKESSLRTSNALGLSQGSVPNDLETSVTTELRFPTEIQDIGMMKAEIKKVVSSLSLPDSYFADPCKDASCGSPCFPLKDSTEVLGYCDGHGYCDVLEGDSGDDDYMKSFASHLASTCCKEDTGSLRRLSDVDDCKDGCAIPCYAALFFF